MTTVGDHIQGCIQIGHYGAHEAAPDCLVIDEQGRCVNPQTCPTTPEGSAP